MRCPYCWNKVSIDELKTYSNRVKCPTCSRCFKVVSTDYNNHSPSEISDRLPFIRIRLGELRTILIREDQRICSVCGSFYTKKDAICLNLIEEMKVWYANPELICEYDPSISADLVRKEIETFLRKKVKKAVLVSVIST